MMQLINRLDLSSAWALLIPAAAVALLMLPGCAVVVERYGAANVFGYATSGEYDANEPYNVNLLSCETELQPLKITEVPNTAGDYFNTVSGEFTNAAGWTYTTASSKLSASSIHVKTYDAQGTPTRVGAEMHVLYRPGSSDPSTNIHWIQTVSSNHSLKPPAGHGNSATYVDIFAGGTTPYYDEFGAADSGNCSGGCSLYDFPGRVDASKDHNWEATTFLVQGPAVGSGAGAITFLRPGFKWGWVNDCEFIIDFPWSVFYIERPIAFAIADTLAPGAFATLAAEDAELILMKGDSRVPVELRSAKLSLQIGKQIDQGGYYPFDVREGVIELGEFELQDMRAEPTESPVRRGSGYVHWETGEASIQFETRIDLSSGAPIDMLFTGTALVHRDKASFTLQVDTKGVERRPEDDRQE